MSQGEIILIILIIGGVVSLQFFQGRKLNVALMRYYIRGFENNLKPKDQLYTWIGGYVGFKVQYEIDDDFIKQIEMSLTLLPRQSLLYLPISLITRRHDRLYVIIRLKQKLGYDAHIIKTNFYFPGPPLEDIKTYKKEIVNHDNNKFYIFYKNKDDIGALEKLVKRSMDFKNIKHIGYTRETNVIFLLLKPDPNKTPTDLKKLVNNLQAIVNYY
ncbi:MAG TPA: hypothetical protein P5272_03835 [Caldisericia bacterium]|nr:hypothetical protein [Caldisericia bacterium]HOL82863.1 hypothetical protein [Caldisericia bacterium]HON83624.1 hypothetical protein [Caldisericia bacterium]HPC56346.1 hypothetical protein [Caldisericia bacterium]HPP43208.1 hypothetical protein [Caldisericia bacterium]